MHMRLAVALLLVSGTASGFDGGPEGGPNPPVPAVPAAEAQVPYVAVAGGADIRVRAGPNANYRVLEHLPKGSWLIVTGMEGEFARVRIPGGVPVYVAADLVEVAADGRAGTVRKSDVLMRPTAGQEFFPLEGQKLQEGDAVTVLGKEAGETGEWLKVLPPAGTEYFVAASLLDRVAAEGERADELARITLERRDGYTGGKEAEEAREAERKREAMLAAMLDAAAEALAKAPAPRLPEDAEARRADLRKVMTESGVQATRGRAGKVSRDYLVRERDMKVAEAKAEKAAVAADLQNRLAEVDAKYRGQLDDLLKVAPRPAAPRFRAIGLVRRNSRGDFELVKGGVVLHSLMSLRYELADFAGLRVGVHGEDVMVDEAHRVVFLRVDRLEILE